VSQWHKGARAACAGVDGADVSGRLVELERHHQAKVPFDAS